MDSDVVRCVCKIVQLYFRFLRDNLVRTISDFSLQLDFITLWKRHWATQFNNDLSRCIQSNHWSSYECQCFWNDNIYISKH
jgi:hypothetical protein